MSDIFSGDYEASAMNSDLEKAMNAGYGTDAASYESGRSLQREDLEATLTTVLDVAQQDCKVFHKVHKQEVNSTVHQYERQTDVGNEQFMFIGEGEKATEADPHFERKYVETKYMSSKWQVSHPMTLTNNVENPINAQKVSAVLRVTKGTEAAFFHGDSSINAKEYDGMLKIIRDSAADTSKDDRLRATRVDLRGKEIGEANNDGIETGLDLFNGISEKVYSKGGDLAEAYFPPVVAGQFWNVMADRLRFNTGDANMGFTQLPDIPTATGSVLKIKNDCGADKMFKVKGKISAFGDTSLRPNTPATVTAVAAADSSSQFTTGFAGNYVYAVHAINAYGISAAKAIDSAVAVAAGDKVTLTITPDSNGAAPTGYIITRSNAGGTELMEMVRVPNKGGVESATTVIDLNADLPGTASIVLLTPNTNEMKPNVSFAQLMGMSNFDLPTDSSLAHRGVVALYGALELRAPEFCAVIDNVGYNGGLY